MSIQFLSCSANLPGRIAAALAKSATRDFSKIVIVVPSRRLGNYVRRALAELVTACVPPRICTLDELAALIPPQQPRRRISTTEQILVLTELLHPGRFQHFCRGMEEDLARFFDELSAEALLPGVFEKIRELLRSDEFKDERHLERLLQQTNELEKLHTAYERFLERHSLIDAAHDLAARMKSLARHGHSPFRSFFQEIFLIGFFDATRTQKELLSHLVQSCKAHFWTHAEPSFLTEPEKAAAGWFSRVNPFLPLIELLKAMGEKGPANAGVESTDATPNESIIRAAYALPFQRIEGASTRPAAAIHLHEAATPLAEGSELPGDRVVVCVVREIKPEPKGKPRV